MRRSDCLRRLSFSFLFLLACVSVCAQDALPGKAPADRNSERIYDSKAMEGLMRYVPVASVMPSSFRGTAENRISDPERELWPFWKKLSEMSGPVRVVHIGDSHVRGHLYPYVVRQLLEEDFGKDAVLDMKVSYRTSGIAHETGSPGIVYHILGVNGATCASFSTPERIHEVTSLEPDLVIVSFGTNEAHGRGYSSAEHRLSMDRLLSAIGKECPDAVFLLTAPPGAYVRNGRHGPRNANPRTPGVVQAEKSYAASHGLAFWDLYDIVGGKDFACSNWNAGHYYQWDKIHFTVDGYRLQGQLLHEAIIKAYNDYVESELDDTGD